jgi:hypothetical protein
MRSAPNNLFLKKRNRAILPSRNSTRRPLQARRRSGKAARIRRTTVFPFFADKRLKSHKTPKENLWKSLENLVIPLGKAWKSLEQLGV